MTEKTMTMPNSALAWRTLDTIDAIDERLWEQSWWFTVTSAGLAANFAGWACIISGDSPDLPAPVECLGIGEGFSMVRVAGGNQLRPVRARATQLLGFDRGHSWMDQLFRATNTREDLGRLVTVIFGPRPAGGEGGNVTDGDPA